MEKLSLLTMALLLSTSMNISSAQIIEKKTKRYFKLGEQEYVCNSDNRISEDSAKNILKRVQKVYNKAEFDNKNDIAVVDVAWNSLHKVCSGEVYDQILFTCLKYKLSSLFRNLKLVEKNIELPFLGNKEESKMKIYIGRVLYTWVKWWQSGSYCETYIVASSVDGRTEEGSLRLKRWLHIHGLNEGYHATPRLWGKNINAAFATIERLSRDEEKIAIDWACKYFCNKCERLFTYWIDHCDENSFILDTEWDRLLVKLPKPVLTLPKGKDNKAEYSQDAINVLAARVLEMCMKYSQSDQCKKELVQFGKSKRLKFKVPDPKKEDGKLLF